MSSSVGSTRVLHDWHHDDQDAAKREIIAALGDISGFEVFGSQVLVASYVRPVKTSGGIITPGSAQHEDFFQGTVGLVVKMGPMAFRGVATNEMTAEESQADINARCNGRIPEVGDWVYFRPQDSVMISIKGPGSVMDKEGGRTLRDFEGWRCKLVFARDIYGRVTLPHIVV
jgi:hypothetical protein